MKPVSELLHRTPWWAMILAGVATFAGLAFFVTPYHIIQYRDDGKTTEESRAIKREVDNAFAENAINVGRGVLRGMISRTTDPERRAVSHIGDGVGFHDGFAIGIPPELAGIAVDGGLRHRCGRQLMHVEPLLDDLVGIGGVDGAVGAAMPD